MSFIEPNIGQVQQNKKILLELEEKKRRMRSSTGIMDLLNLSLIINLNGIFKARLVPLKVL